MKSATWIWNLSGLARRLILKSENWGKKKKDSEAISLMNKLSIESKLRASSQNSITISIPKSKTSKSNTSTKLKLSIMKIPNWRKSSTPKTNKSKVSWPKIRKSRKTTKTHWLCWKDKMKTWKTRWSRPNTSTIWNWTTWRISSMEWETQSWVYWKIPIKTNWTCWTDKSTNFNKLLTTVQGKCKSL